MRLSAHHQEVDGEGVGKCSVPMWSGGSPAGFCDRPAYGFPPPSPTYWSHSANRQMRLDGRYDGYVPALACPAHGGPASRVFLDGAAWCAILPDFVNLQESPAGFGDTPDAARQDLHRVCGGGL